MDFIYLNPIFEAHSNHRYNTANYLRVDPLLGTEEDFAELCARAKERGIAVILDGVFEPHRQRQRVFQPGGPLPHPGGRTTRSSPPITPWYTFRQWPQN